MVSIFTQYLLVDRTKVENYLSPKLTTYYGNTTWSLHLCTRYVLYPIGLVTLKFKEEIRMFLMGIKTFGKWGKKRVTNDVR